MRACLVIVLAMAMAMAPVVSADEQRASINYRLHCQGCHLPEAQGYKDEVPRMNEFVGYFLYSREGREFIIRVPGVATTSLPDDQLTELVNWLLLTFSSGQLPESFEPYTIAEVAALRSELEPNPQKTRIRLLQEIARDLPQLADELAAQNSR